MPATLPYRVPQEIGFVIVEFARPGDPLDHVAAFLHRSPAPFGIRLAGGCSGMSPEAKQHMLEFFGNGLFRFEGFASSGGTRQITVDGMIDPMVTDVPGILRAQSPRVLTLSTLPQTDTIGLVEDSRMVLQPDGRLVPNPGVHMLVVVQDTLGERLGWDGDVRLYLDLFQTQVVEAGWRFGMVVYNGGDVTRQEVAWAIQMGWVIILIRGSGRQADILIGEIEGGQLDLAPFLIVDNGDSAGLDAAMVHAGLIAA
jgi:hypothetical protein